jgi:hypothetical protein
VAGQRAQALPRKDRQTIASWALADRRPYTQLDALWQKYRQLPAPQQEEIKRLLGEWLSGPHLTLAPATNINPTASRFCRADAPLRGRAGKFEIRPTSLGRVRYRS